MKSTIPIVLSLVLGAVVGSFLTNAIVSTSAGNLAREKFYEGMTLFCSIAPPPPGSSFVNAYSEGECADMIDQARTAGYYEQSLTPQNEQLDPANPGKEN